MVDQSENRPGKEELTIWNPRSWAFRKCKCFLFEQHLLSRKHAATPLWQLPECLSVTIKKGGRVFRQSRANGKVCSGKSLKQFSVRRLGGSDYGL